MSKYDDIETGWILTDFEAVARPPVVAPLPRDVVCRPRIIASDDGTNSYSVDVEWQFPLNSTGTREFWVTGYYVEIRRSGASYGSRQEVSQLYARYENVGAGSFSARVAAIIGANGKVSQFVESGTGTLTTVQAVADASSANYSGWITEF